MTKKLTPKQRQFAENFVETGNLYQSAVDAGYSKAYARSSGAVLRENAGVKAYIDELMAEIKSKKVMDATEAVELLTSIARGETKETVISSTPAGVYESEKSADLKTRISAVREILKRYPDSDKLLVQQVRKLTAEADIAESKATEAKALTDSDSRTVIVDDAEELEDDHDDE